MSALDVSVLRGKTLSSVTGADGAEQLLFECTDGSDYRMWHEQDCCESVRLQDVIGDLSDLIGSPLIVAEAVSGDDSLIPAGHQPDPESETWTFYRFATIKGTVTLRWYGSSNGYYSEEVSFAQIGGGK